MHQHIFMLQEGEKIRLEVHPDAIITEDFILPDGTVVHAVIGEEEQLKLMSLQNILSDERE